MKIKTPSTLSILLFLISGFSLTTFNKQVYKQDYDVDSNKTKKIEINYRIGYKNEIPFFYITEYSNNYKRDCIYFFKNGFQFYETVDFGHIPLFINDSCEVFSFNNSNVLLLKKKINWERITLPYIPIWIIASNNGDTFYYTAVETSMGGNDVSNINIFDVKNKINEVSQVQSDYEGLWYTKSGIEFSKTENIVNKSIGEIERTKSALFLSKSILVNEISLIDSASNEKYYEISENGFFGIRKKNMQEFSLIYFNKRKEAKTFKIASTNFCFFYKNQIISCKRIFYYHNEDYKVINFDILRDW